MYVFGCEKTYATNSKYYWKYGEQKPKKQCWINFLFKSKIQETKTEISLIAILPIKATHKNAKIKTLWK